MLYSLRASAPPQKCKVLSRGGEECRGRVQTITKLLGEPCVLARRNPKSDRSRSERPHKLKKFTVTENAKKPAQGRLFCVFGWGTRIRTLVDGVRVRSPAARRSPKFRRQGQGVRAKACRIFYLFEYCGRLRALCRPTFFRSTSRASRVRKPALRIRLRNSSSKSTNARAIP